MDDESDPNNGLESLDSLLRAAASSKPSGIVEVPGPQWVCVGCGSVDRCRTIKYEIPGEATEYDLECNDCGSREVEEGYHSALHRVLDKRDAVIELLERIRQWDMLDAAADGVYWKREIDKVLR